MLGYSECPNEFDNDSDSLHPVTSMFQNLLLYKLLVTISRECITQCYHFLLEQMLFKIIIIASFFLVNCD